MGSPASLTQWQPIETAPRNGTRILVWAEGDGPFEMHWNTMGWNWLVSRQLGIWEGDGFTWYEADGHGPTHWMPLPEPPHHANLASNDSALRSTSSREA